MSEQICIYQEKGIGLILSLFDLCIYFCRGHGGRALGVSRPEQNFNGITLSGILAVSHCTGLTQQSLFCALVSTGTWCHVVACHGMACHGMAGHAMPWHAMERLGMPRHATLRHAMSMSYHVMSYHTIPYHTIPYHTISHHITSHPITSHHIISNHITPYMI